MFGGFDHWWYMISEEDRIVILQDLSKAIEEVYDANNE